MAKTYVTFGQVHVHSVNGKTFDKDCVATIECSTEEEGRRKAFEHFGRTWCFEHFEDQFDHSSLKYFPRGLIPVEGRAT